VWSGASPPIPMVQQLPYNLKSATGTMQFSGNICNFGNSQQHACDFLSSVTNKQLSYHRDSMWQGGSVLAKSGRQYTADIIGLSSTTVMWTTSKAIEFGKIMQNKGYYAIPGHSRSPMSVPIESLYVTSYWWLILTDILSHTISKLSNSG